MYIYTNVILAEKFGWTIDYIETLSAVKRRQIIAVLNGQAKVREHRAAIRKGNKGRR